MTAKGGGANPSTWKILARPPGKKLGAQEDRAGTL